MTYLHQVYKTICIYGIGKHARKYLTLDFLDKITLFIDNAPRKTDAADTLEKDAAYTLYGKPVVTSEEIKSFDISSTLIIIGSVKYYDEIAKQLTELGYTENINFVSISKIVPQFWNNQNGICTFHWNPKHEAKSKKTWLTRAKCMLQLLPPDCSSLLDIGAGNSYIKELVPSTCKYLSMDIDASKNPDYVCDLNADCPIRIENVDYFFMSGIIEYIVDLRQFLTRFESFINKGIILSYHPYEFYTNLSKQRPLEWRNCLSVLDLLVLFHECGYSLTDFNSSLLPQFIFVFKKQAQTKSLCT